MHINELSNIINISQNTIRIWEKDFNISVKRDHKGVRIYDRGIVDIYKEDCK